MLRFLVNPAAGGGRARLHLATLTRRARAIGAEVSLTGRGGEVTDQARRAVEDGVARLVVAGGDGTMHLAVQALAASGCALGLLPIGRGNDLASALAVPREFDKALELAIEGETRRIDLGRCGRQYFASYVGAGFDSAVARTADTQPRWWPDRITYIVAMLRTLIGFRPPSARIEFDGGRFEGHVMFASVCNGPQFGGGMRIAPEAEMDDGLLDLVVVRALPKAALLRVFPRVYSGAHVDHPAISFHRTRSARLSFEPETPVGSDGEQIGVVGDHGIEAEVVPAALAVVGGSAC